MDASRWPEPLDELGRSHKWESGLYYPATGKARGFIARFALQAFCREVSKAACFRSRKDGAATDGTPMNHGPASAAGARRKLPGGAAAGAERFGRPHARSEGSSPTHQCALGGWGLVRRAVRFPNAILVDAVGAWMSGGGGGGAMDGRLTGRTPAAAWSRCAPSWRRSVRRGTMWACSSSSVNPKHRFLQGKIVPVDWGAAG